MIKNSSSATPWVERYRPKSLDDVAHQKEVVATLQNAVETGRLPHLLFYGPPGTGKTSVALALCRQLWPPSQWRQRVLELNASDERGIAVVRDKIKHFASLAVGTGPTKKTAAAFFQSAAAAKKEQDEMNDDNETNYPNPPFKIIILDEADTVTSDAQAALRRVIEAHSRITRFILICNYVTRIIEPLASRCAKFRFQPLPPASMKDRLMSIARAEQCTAREIRVLDDILLIAQGDMRRAVTTLQSLHALALDTVDEFTKDDMEITTDENNLAADQEIIAEIAGLPPFSVTERLWKALSSTSSFNEMQIAVDDVVASGFSAQLLISALLPKLMEEPNLTEQSKALIAIRMAEAEKNMIEGADEYLQLMTLCSLTLSCFEESQKMSN